MATGRRTSPPKPDRTCAPGPDSSRREYAAFQTGGNVLARSMACVFQQGKRCKVWDLDGNEYVDMSIMGIGTNTLGYGIGEVDAAVRRTIKPATCPPSIVRKRSISPRSLSSCILGRTWRVGPLWRRGQRHNNSDCPRCFGKDKVRFAAITAGMIGSGGQPGRRQKARWAPAARPGSQRGTAESARHGLAV